MDIARSLPSLFCSPILHASGELVVEIEEGFVSLWPFLPTVDRDQPARAPWRALGRMLARLHRTDVALLAQRTGGDIPPAGVTSQPLEVVRKLRGSAVVDRQDVLRAAQVVARRLAQRDASSKRCLIHGDVHLGQLVQSPAGDARDAGWRFVDVDDVGLAEPIWDLARFGAWRAIDLMPPSAFEDVIGAYLEEGGPAIGERRLVWEALDVPAQALAVHMAARNLLSVERGERPADEIVEALVAACGRIASSGEPSS